MKRHSRSNFAPKKDPSIIAAFWDCPLCGDHYSSGDEAQVLASAQSHAMLHKKDGYPQGNLAFPLTRQTDWLLAIVAYLRKGYTAKEAHEVAA